MLPTPEEIRQTESRERPLLIEPWIAAHLSRLWQTMRKNIQETIVVDSSTIGQANPMGRPQGGTYSSGTASSVGTQEPPQTVQSTPASARNHS